MAQNISQKYYKIISYLQQLKNTLNILVALLKLIRGNLMEFQKKVLKKQLYLLQLLLIIIYYQM